MSERTVRRRRQATEPPGVVVAEVPDVTAVRERARVELHALLAEARSYVGTPHAEGAAALLRALQAVANL